MRSVTRYWLGLCLAVGVATAVGAPAVAGTTSYPGGRYDPGPARYGVATESTFLTMNDGVKLEAQILSPASPGTQLRAPGRFPVIVEHDPYNPASGLSTEDYLVEHGYIVLYVRPRGTGTSGGQGYGYPPTARDAQDAPRIVSYAAHDIAGSNGVVGLWGCSLPGIYALGDAAAVGPRSPVRAMVAACAGSESVEAHDAEFDDGIVTPGEAVVLKAYCGLIGDGPLGTTPGAATCAAIQDMGTNILSGGDLAYDRSFWQSIDGLDAPQKIVSNGIPALLWDDWGDPAIIKASTDTYAAFQNAADHRPANAPMRPGQRVSGRYQMIIGPTVWGHGGGLDPGIILEWFDTFLKHVNTGIQHTATPMHVYEEQANRWVNTSTWPLVNNYAKYYLGGAGALAASKPAQPGGDSIVWGQPSESDGTTLTYTSRPVAGGATIAGPMSASVYASSSNTQLELVASLDDVAPDGTTTPISDDNGVLGSQRAEDPALTWHDRNGTLIRPWWTQQGDQYLTPGHVYRLDFWFGPTLYRLPPGHVLRLTIDTEMSAAVCQQLIFGNQPCYLTAPQTDTLSGGQYVLYHSVRYPSALNLPVVPFSAFTTARSGVTPTSSGVAEPLTWGG